MKKIKYILYTILASLFIVGCDDVEKASQDPADIGSTEDYPIATFTLSSGSTTVNESDETIITYDITFDRPINRAVDFNIEQTGGNATLDEDFIIESATVAAYTTSAQLSILVLNDDIIEGTETADLQIISGPSIANRYLINPKTVLPALTLTIENYESPDLQIDLAWDAIYEDADGAEHHLCDLDLDLEIYPADFSDPVATSYSSCPESIRIPGGALPDGDYWIVPSFWTNDGAAEPATNVVIPAMLTLSKPGVVVNDPIDLTGIWDFETGGQEEGNSDAYLVRYSLNISGTTYTVTDEDTGTVIFQN